MNEKNSKEMRVADRSQVLIGRLRKRIAKLMQQRDHWRAHAERLEYALRIAPGIRQSVEKYELLRARAERLRELETSHWPMVHEVQRLRRALESVASHFDESYSLGCLERIMGDNAREALGIKTTENVVTKRYTGD